MKIKRARLSIIAKILILRGLLDLSYIYLVSPLFSYAGFTTYVNYEQLYVSYALVLAMASFLPLRQDRPSTNIAFIFFVIGYLPVSSMYALMPGDSRYFILFTLAFAVLFATIALVPRFKAPPDTSQGLQILLGLTILAIIYTFIVVVMRGGLSLATLDILKVYDVRRDINEQVLYGLVGKTSTWCAKVFVPALFIYGLWRRQFLVVVISVILTVALFAVTSTKGALAYPILALVAYYGQKTNKFQDYFISSAIGVVALAFLTYWSTGTIVIAGVLLDRIFYVPALLDFQYYEFFQTHPLTYWSDTFMSFFYPYPYNDPVAVIIGTGSWQPGEYTYANTGIFATGYQQFGVAGMIVFPMAVGVALKVFDGLVYGRMPIYVGFSLSVVAAVQFLSADLTTTFLTHGVFMAWLALYLVGHRSLAPARETPQEYALPEEVTA